MKVLASGTHPLSSKDFITIQQHPTIYGAKRIRFSRALTDRLIRLGVTGFKLEVEARSFLIRYRYDDIGIKLNLGEYRDRPPYYISEFFNKEHLNRDLKGVRPGFYSRIRTEHNALRVSKRPCKSRYPRRLSLEEVTEGGFYIADIARRTGVPIETVRRALGKPASDA